MNANKTDMKTFDNLTDIDIELLRRFALSTSDNAFASGLQWVAKGLTPVKTATAFQLARGGRDVWAVDANGTDYLLEDIEFHSEHYPDKSKSYPDIESIFLIEGEL